MYPEKYLQTNSELNRPEVLKTYEVACDEDGLAEKVEGTFYEVKIDQHSTLMTDGGFECWTPRILMQIIGAVRLNSDLMYVFMITYGLILLFRNGNHVSLFSPGSIGSCLICGTTMFQQ